MSISSLPQCSRNKRHWSALGKDWMSYHMYGTRVVSAKTQPNVSHCKPAIHPPSCCKPAVAHGLETCSSVRRVAHVAANFLNRNSASYSYTVHFQYQDHQQLACLVTVWAFCHVLLNTPNSCFSSSDAGRMETQATAQQGFSIRITHGGSAT